MISLMNRLFTSTFITLRLIRSKIGNLFQANFKSLARFFSFFRRSIRSPHQRDKQSASSDSAFCTLQRKKTRVPLYDPGELAVCSGQITEIGGTILPNWPPASPWIKNPLRETLFSLIGPRLPRGTDLLEDRD